MLAEDDPVIRCATVKLLRRMGLDADAMCNGLEVIKALQSRSYDVIFMDIQMPEMDGLETTRAIRDKWPFSSIRIIAVTSCTQKGDRDACIRAGMDDYIAKPATIENLCAALSRSFSRRGGSLPEIML